MQPSMIKAIGPAEAARMLEKNGNNRPISDSIVKQYAQDMRDGLWRETGNPINVDTDGNLLNGQHRLWAIIESGVTLKFHVIAETEQDAFATFDTGRTRDLSQLVGIAYSEHNDKVAVSGAARLIKMWEEAPPSRGFNTNIIPTRPTMVRYAGKLLQEPAFVWATQIAHQINPLRVGRTWYAAALYIIARKQSADMSNGVRETLQKFHDGVARGIGLTEGDPRLALRNYVTLRGSAGSSTDQRIYMALTVRAWNSWLQGRDIKYLAWRADSEFPEAEIV